MGWIGPGEIILILLLALVLFGPRRLPELGRIIGKGIMEMQKAADISLNDVLEEDKKSEKTLPSPEPDEISEVIEPDFNEKSYGSKDSGNTDKE